MLIGLKISNDASNKSPRWVARAGEFCGGLVAQVVMGEGASEAVPCSCL